VDGPETHGPSGGRPPTRTYRAAHAEHAALVRRGYDEIADAYLDARVAGEGEVLLEHLLRRLGVGDRLLDAGAGAGLPVTRSTLDAGIDVVALDFSSAQLALARRHVPRARLLQGDLVTLPLRDASFDAVASYYAIIHVDRVLHPAVFAEIARVLRPGGHALLCLGARDLPADHDPDSWLGVPMYWSHFDRDTNVRLVGEAGLVVVWDRHVPDPMGHGGHLFVLARRPESS
jgi:SAM-dependent methyltransferase